MPVASFWQIQHAVTKAFPPFQHYLWRVSAVGVQISACAEAAIGRDKACSVGGGSHLYQVLWEVYSWLTGERGIASVKIKAIIRILGQNSVIDGSRRSKGSQSAHTVRKGQKRRNPVTIAITEFLMECKTNWDICGNPWFSRLCGSSPIIFCRFRCDGYGFSTRGSILVFDQKRCPLYPCQKIDWGKRLLHRTHHPRSSSSK